MVLKLVLLVFGVSFGPFWVWVWVMLGLGVLFGLVFRMGNIFSVGLLLFLFIGCFEWWKFFPLLCFSYVSAIVG